MKSVVLFLIFAVGISGEASTSLEGLGPSLDKAQVSVSGYLQGYFANGLSNFQLCSTVQQHDLKKCIDLVVPDSLAPRAAKLRGQCVVAKGKFSFYGNSIVLDYLYSSTGKVVVSNLAACKAANNSFKADASGAA